MRMQERAEAAAAVSELTATPWRPQRTRSDLNSFSLSRHSPQLKGRCHLSNWLFDSELMCEELEETNGWWYW